MLDKLLEADVQNLQLAQKYIDDEKNDFKEKYPDIPFEERFPMIEHQEEIFPMIEHQEDRIPPNIPFEERFPMIEQEDKLK
jgi:hypothetical protein